MPPEAMTLDDARAADRADPLRPFRARFRLPDGVIYLDGNSLGVLPAATPARLAATAEGEWGEGLVRSWNAAGWIDAPKRLGAAIAPLMGASADEVIVTDSTSVNLFKLLAAAMTAQPGRNVILTEPGNFPTDLHVANGLAALLPGVSVRTVPADRIAAALDERVAVLLLTHVHYKTAARHDMAALSAAARAAGALSLWDLSHSVGAIPLAVSADGADMAVGCGYKYLNGGPGAPAFLYVRRDLQPRLASPVTGWLGHAAPFDFADEWQAGAGMARFLAGTPPVLGMAALEEGVGIMREADMSAVAAKSAALFDLFADRAVALMPELRLVSPRDPSRRGSHISFAHDHAHEIVQAVIAEGVIGDFRAPEVLRFGLTPLYLGYEDVWRATDILAAVMRDGRWRDPRFAVRAAVT